MVCANSAVKPVMNDCRRGQTFCRDASAAPPCRESSPSEKAPEPPSMTSPSTAMATLRLYLDFELLMGRKRRRDREENWFDGTI